MVSPNFPAETWRAPSARAGGVFRWALPAKLKVAEHAHFSNSRVPARSAGRAKDRIGMSTGDRSAEFNS